MGSKEVQRERSEGNEDKEEGQTVVGDTALKNLEFHGKRDDS